MLISKSIDKIKLYSFHVFLSFRRLYMIHIKACRKKKEPKCLLANYWLSAFKNIFESFSKKIRRPHSRCCTFALWEMIAVAVQKVPFRTPKAYLLARKSIAFETQNGTSGEQRWKILTNFNLC